MGHLSSVCPKSTEKKVTQATESSAKEKVSWNCFECSTLQDNNRKTCQVCGAKKPPTATKEESPCRPAIREVLQKANEGKLEEEDAEEEGRKVRRPSPEQ